jgi:predicted 3-demethylubiquinone-9 3-methyltransferase (glyoxalase superfamily)
MAIHEPVTFLWFDKQALDAATFYVGLFPDSRIVSVSHYQEGAQKPAGTVLTVEFTLMGRPWAALNGGPPVPALRGRELPGHGRDPGRGRPLVGRARRQRR